MARRAVNRSEVLQWFTRPDGESHAFDMLGDLHRIRCPTLVLGGEDDPIHPIESQADIAAALPQHLVRFERFANCRHAVVTDAPERTITVIRDFIGRCWLEHGPQKHALGLRPDGWVGRFSERSCSIKDPERAKTTPAPEGASGKLSIL
jgi:poly(3-hydroxyalkanoate) synthetase